MKYVFGALFTALVLVGISRFENRWVGKTANLYEAEHENQEANGSRQYNFMRLRNPATGTIPADIRRKELAFAATLPQAEANSRSTTWESRGPNNLGGRTRALALDVTNENIILAGQVSGGMWRSTDGGSHFSKCTQPGQLHSTTCVAQDRRPGKTNVWYYGTGEHYGIVNAAGFSSQMSGDGIFKSTDGGVTWAQLPSTVSGTPTTLYQKRDFDFVWEIVTDSSNAAQDEVYAATVNGIWRSIDGGTSWTAVLGLDTSLTTYSQYTDIAITPTGVLYAAISSETPSKGIWRSEDGITWTNITPAGFPTSYERIEIGIAPSNETRLYFIAYAAAAGTTGHALYHYQYVSGNGTGAGGVWSNRTVNIPDEHCLGFYTFDFREYSSQTSYDMYMVIHPDNPDVVFLGGTNIYRSLDGFTTPAYEWIGGYQCDTSKYSNYIYPNHHPDQHKLLFLPSNHNVAISGTDGGLMKTTNIMASPVVWEYMNNNYNTGQFYTCAIEPGNTTNEVIVGGLQDNGSFFTNTLDYNANWKHVFYGDGGYCAVTRNRTNYYLSWQTGKVFKFDIADNGTVNNLTRIDPIGGTNYLFIVPFILDPLDDTRMYLCTGRTISRNDSLHVIPLTGNEYNAISQGWSKLTGSSTGVTLAAPRISCLDMSEANTNILYYGTDQGQVYRLDSCRTNNAAAKVALTSAQFPAGAYVSCIEVDRLNHNNVLATFSNYGVKSIFYSTDAGATWASISGNLEQNPDGSGNGPSVNWAHIYNDGTTVKYYVGTSTGLYSADALNGDNTTWQQEGANTIGNVVINMITSRVADQNIVVATHGNGMYSNKVFVPSAVPTVNNDMNVQCYPNPFTDKITIQTTGTKSTVKVYALNGKLLADLKPGTTEWNGRTNEGGECVPGTYLLQITNGNKTVTKKVVKL
jgi:hypothetical protein